MSLEFAAFPDNGNVTTHLPSSLLFHTTAFKTNTKAGGCNRKLTFPIINHNITFISTWVQIRVPPYRFREFPIKKTADYSNLFLAPRGEVTALVLRVCLHVGGIFWENVKFNSDQFGCAMKYMAVYSTVFSPSLFTSWQVFNSFFSLHLKPSYESVFPQFYLHHVSTIVLTEL